MAQWQPGGLLGETLPVALDREDQRLAALTLAIGAMLRLRLADVQAAPLYDPASAPSEVVCVYGPIAMPEFVCSDAPRATTAAKVTIGFMAVHPMAVIACMGETPREALRRLAGLLYHQFDALDSSPSGRGWILVAARECRVEFPSVANYTGAKGPSADAIGLWRKRVGELVNAKYAKPTA